MPPAASAEGAPVAQLTNDGATGGVRTTNLPADEGLRKVVDAALADAALRTARDARSRKVESVEMVIWPDGGLGCPVPGYRIRIRSAERVLDYHASRRGNVVLCPPRSLTNAVPGAAT